MGGGLWTLRVRELEQGLGFPTLNNLTVPKALWVVALVLTLENSGHFLDLPCRLLTYRHYRLRIFVIARMKNVQPLAFLFCKFPALSH